MSASLNRVQLIGNLGLKPNVITGKNGQTFVTATMATNESFKKDDGWETIVHWHQLIFFGNQAKVCEYLDKGSQVYIEGKIRTNQWTDKDGNNRQSYSIVVTNTQILGKSKSNEEAAPDNTATHHLDEMRQVLSESTSDIPF